MNYKRIIPLLLLVLGFATACERDDDDENSGQMSKYGVVPAKYQQKSNVSTENTLDIALPQ
jgi:hypothetical protein